MTPQKDDALFQLSLTELAFIMVFVVLLLVGAKFVVIGGDVKKCEKDRKSCEEKTNVCLQEKDACHAALKTVTGGNPNEIIDNLENAAKLRQENSELQRSKKKIEDELKALEDLKKKFPNAQRLKTAEDFLDSYEKNSKINVPMDEAKKMGEQAAQLEHELANCRGQLSHCVKVTGASKGYGLPPCWTDSTGQIQFLFSVDIRPDGLSVSRAWPDDRAADAQQLPGLQDALASPIQSLDRFKSSTQPIFEQSRKSNPECRHYVIVRRAKDLRDIDQFNRLRLGVEDYFYKLDRTATSAP